VANWPVRLRRRDDQAVPCLLSVAVRRGPDGEILGYQGFIRDDTAARLAQEDLQLQKAFLESLFHRAPEAIAVLDNEERIIRVNEEFRRLFGFSPEEAQGRKINSLIVDPDHKSEANGYSRAVLVGETIAVESLRQRNDGSLVPVSIVGAPVEVGGGRVGIYVIYRDITAQKQAEEALRDSERRHRVVLESAPDPIVVYDVEGRVTYLNPAFSRIFGWSLEEVRGRKLDFVPVENWPETAIMIQMVKRGETFSGIETRRLTKDGRVIDVSISGGIYVDSKGHCQGSVVTLQDITVRKLTEEQLRFIAYHDPLTGLPNRKSFYERLEELLNQSGRDAGHCFGLLFLDLDRFKYINDTLCHDVGDLLLKQVGYRLEDNLRKTDHVFRLGGDEFTIILSSLSHDFDAAKVAEKLLEVIAQPYQIKGHLLYVSTSIGISIYPADGKTVEALVRNADTAMYEAKKDENRYRFFTAEMNNKALLRLQMENLLRVALDKDQFTLHYQPLVDDGRGIVGVEALLRWSSPELGEVGPELFIPVAEETGLIVSLGEWVLNQACRQVKAWQEAGRADLYVAVNLSPRQFRHKGLVQTIARILGETGLAPACLKLEVTESSVMENPEEAIAKMRHLHSLGLRFAIDDFGTGYSSLSYLKRFPVETLKIDRSFVQELASSSDDEEIVKTIIAMARNLNIETLAEGVETDEQRRFLLKQGCQKMQGFLFGRPLPPEEIERLWAMGRQT
jgi:diguanylate cyclase (GGDEF)-like protein/PAS domain S-box-containing protein